MAYVTICDECLVGAHEHCGESKLEPEREQIVRWNAEHPGEELVGGGICVCRHGEPENEFERSIREQVAKSRV